MTADNLLGRDDRPRFFEAAGAGERGLAPPAPRRDVAVRTYARALAGMQKEAVVVSSATGRAWRLVSDEGPYLNGYDEAPFPLAFMGAGMVASYWNAIAAAAAARGVPLAELRLSLDSFYTMEGSALRGTMTGGALPPELAVEGDGVDAAELERLCRTAVGAAVADGLVRGALTSRFTLTVDGRLLPVGRVSTLDAPVPFPSEGLAGLPVAGPPGAEALMRRTQAAELREGEGGRGSSLEAEQKRTLHLRSLCAAGADGVKEIEIQLFRPHGSTFHLRSEEDPAAGRAPDAATLISSGVGFCFLTQLGRYAAITKKSLGGYRVVQDTHFSVGVAGEDPVRPAEADPVETHVELDAPEDEGFARALVDMGEQTCFLHALCRTSLAPEVRVGAPEAG